MTMSTSTGSTSTGSTSAGSISAGSISAESGSAESIPTGSGSTRSAAQIAAPSATSPDTESTSEGQAPVVDVMFPLIDDEEWPPYPAETLDAALIAHDLAEITGVPWFANNISRGDIVRVGHDGIGYVGGTVVSRGGHSTVHVLATTEAELVPIVRDLRALGAVTSAGLTPPMLTVDVPESCSLEAVLDVLAAAESLTCAHNVACRQHPTRAAS